MIYNWSISNPWITNSQTDTEWKYKIDYDKLYLAFRGTTSKKDWRQNFTFFPIPVLPYKDMYNIWFVHMGFKNKWDSVKHEIGKLINDVSPKEVVCSGFSQGGAIAQLAMEYVWYNFPNIEVSGEIWGSPRVIFAINRKLLSERFAGLTRHEIRGDVIPHLPLNIMGYVHYGEMVKHGKLFNRFFKFREKHMRYDEYIGEE